MQTIPHQGKRVETGPIQFGDDWPGVFIRGDNAFALAMSLQAVLGGRKDVFSEASVRGLLELLQSCDTRRLNSTTPTKDRPHG